MFVLQLTKKSVTVNSFLVICILLLSSCNNDVAPSLEFDSRGLYNAAISEEGDLAIVSTLNKSSALWDLKNNKKLFDWTFTAGEDHAATNTAISGNGNIAITASSSAIAIWDTKTGLSKGYLKLNGTITQIKLSAAGNKALVSFANNSIQLIDLKTSKIIWEVRYQAYIETVDLSADSRYAAVGTDDNTVTVWDIHNNKKIRQWEDRAKIRFVAISPKNNYVISSSPMKTIKLWNINTGKLERELQTAPRFLSWLSRPFLNISSAKFSEDESIIAIGCPPRDIYLWDLASGEIIKKWHIPKMRVVKPTAAIIYALAIDQKNKNIVAASSNGRGYLFKFQDTLK